MSSLSVMRMGYVQDLPPVMLTADELEAVVLGAQWVQAHGEAVRVRAKSDVVAMVSASTPEGSAP